MSEGEGYEGTNLNPIFRMASPVQSAASETGALADVHLWSQMFDQESVDGRRPHCRLTSGSHTGLLFLVRLPPPPPPPPLQDVGVDVAKLFTTRYELRIQNESSGSL